jgi:RNA polymerase sigma factor for flagellar operon FliA
MDPRHLIEDNLGLIDRVVRRVCRRGGVAAGDVDDFASVVKLALVENDYAILRCYEGRSSLSTYLTIVIQRMLGDQRERMYGRWQPSREAEGLGQRAVLIEDLIGRQRRSVDEAMPIIRSVDASITRSEVVEIADRLPRRAPRPREVPLPEEEVVPLPASDRADTAALDHELRTLSQRAGTLLRNTMAAWPAPDRMLLRLRFESSLTIADIARLMKVPQRPLYRRLEALLDGLRAILLNGGIDPATADDLLGASHRIEMNFGQAWKNGEVPRTKEETGYESVDEQSP